MLAKKQIIFVGVYTILLSALIFVGRSIFFSYSDLEESYVEPSLDQYSYEYESFSGVTQSEINSVLHDLIYKEFKEKYEADKKKRIQIKYIPMALFQKIEFSYLPLVETFLYHKHILHKIDSLGIFLHTSRSDTRGRMKSAKIHMYGVTEMSDEEFLSVLIHEFAHYIDIYALPGSHFGDESQKFYDISWESVSVMKKGLDGSDFVSGYAMTNKYEDFAESYTYYVLHNKDFFKKSQKSKILAKKYDFLKNYIFDKNMFFKENFSAGEEYKPYYWDVTKIPIDVKNFLQYLQKTL